MNIVSIITIHTIVIQLYNRLNPVHLAKVNNEAVSLVEAGPGHVHLCCSDGPPTLDVQQALHVHVIGHHMLKTRGHAPFL